MTYKKRPLNCTVVEYTITDELYNEADAYSEFRKECKKFLANNNEEHDKFTVTDDDTYLGYITEKFICNYIPQAFGNSVIVTGWDEQYDLKRIQKIIESNSGKPEDIQYVREYFYDKYDLSIKTAPNSPYEPVDVKADVKTAKTAKTPASGWKFLYPVVQASKPGKDLAILVYFHLTDIDDRRSLDAMYIIGYIYRLGVIKLKIQPQGTLTRQGTVSQIDNYITDITYYHQLNELFKKKK